MNFLNKVVSKQIIYIPVIITIFFILLIITITTEKKVVMGKEYNDKDELIFEGEYLNGKKGRGKEY